LLEALRLEQIGYLALFEAWDQENEDKNTEYYRCWRFVADFAGFAESKFAGSPGVVVMARLTRAVAERMLRGDPAAQRIETYVQLLPEFLIADVQGDVMRVTELLSRHMRAGPEVLERLVTVVVKAEGKHSRYFEFPELTVRLLRHADRAGTVADIVDTFERERIQVGRLSPSATAIGGLRYLEDEGFIRFVEPEAAAPCTSEIAVSAV
jgi:hypothetical protein